MRRNNGSGSTGVVAVLAVLALLAGLGAWNFFRNLHSEQQVFRPYRSVSDAELEQLAEAYSAESERAGVRYGAAQSSGAEVRDHPLLGERLDEFERVRRRSERTRELGARASELESTLGALDEEMRIRDAERDRVALFLKRLLTI